MWIEKIATPRGGYQFRAYNAASTAAAALAHPVVIGFYVIGVLSCVFHLANGIWTMGITWGVWVSPSAQRGANYACLLFGLALAAIGLGGIGGFARLGNNETKLEEARQTEDRMYEFQTKAGIIKEAPDKRVQRDEDSQDSPNKTAQTKRAPTTASVNPGTPSTTAR